MPHTRLVQISTEHAKATGFALAELHKLRSAGLPVNAMVALGTLEGHLATLANLNAEQGAIAHRIADEASVEGDAEGGQTSQ